MGALLRSYVPASVLPAPPCAYHRKSAIRLLNGTTRLLVERPCRARGSTMRRRGKR
jgi:hypothetical protein